MNEQERLIDEATRWIVLINSGQASPGDYQAYREWRAVDPRHEHLCSRLEVTLGVLQVPAAQGVGSGLIRHVLAAPSSRRRLLQRTLVGAGLMVGGGLLGHRMVPLDGLSADLHTATGQRQTFTLPDGSQLVLNARSAADVDFDPQRRLVRLRSGELLATVASDALRPFVVETAMGRASLSGNRLLVRQLESATHVVAFDAPVALASLAGDHLQLPAGQQVRFDRIGFGSALPSQGTEAAWIDGYLEVRDRPLSEVIDALRPYRAGLMRVDPAIAELRVSGLFRLDDSDLVLEALARTLPIRVARRSDLWITLSAA